MEWNNHLSVFLGLREFELGEILSRFWCFVTDRCVLRVRGDQKLYGGLSCAVEVPELQVLPRNPSFSETCFRNISKHLMGEYLQWTSWACKFFWSRFRVCELCQNIYKLIEIRQRLCSFPSLHVSACHYYRSVNRRVQMNSWHTRPALVNSALVIWNPCRSMWSAIDLGFSFSQELSARGKINLGCNSEIRFSEVNWQLFCNCCSSWATVWPDSWAGCINCIFRPKFSTFSPNGLEMGWSIQKIVCFGIYSLNCRIRVQYVVCVEKTMLAAEPLKQLFRQVSDFFFLSNGLMSSIL